MQLPQAVLRENYMPKRILIVEDFDDLRDALSIMFDLMGLDVAVAADGREAVAQAKEHRPDLILMDLAMPAFDGIMATREIRSLPEFSQVPIVAVTAHGQHLRDAAMEAGCTDVVDKPFVMEHIKEVLEKYLSEN